MAADLLRFAMDFLVLPIALVMTLFLITLIER